MAWTAPRTWVVSEVVTAAEMNAHVRDNLNYLKGNAGAVVISDRLSVPTVNAVANAGFRHAGASGDVTALQGYDGSGVSALIMGVNRYYDGSAFQQFNTRAGSVFQITDNGFSYNAFAISSNTAIPRWAITAAGNFGVGTTTPRSAFHVIDSTTSGGMLFLTAAAVNNTLQTLAAAGTVTQSATFWLYDRANTGGALFPISGNALNLAGTFNIVNGDTIAVTVTAGGAITVQRTAGVASTHEIQMMVLYK